MYPIRSAVLAMRLSLFILVCLTACSALISQGQRVTAPNKKVPPKLTSPVPSPQAATQRSLVGGLWKVDSNFKSSIYIKNLVETSSVTVTPILYLSNGVELDLNPVTLDPSGTSVVDINAALASKGIAPFSSLSGYVEVRYTWQWDPVCVTVRDVDVNHSLIFTYGLQPAFTSPTSFLGPSNSVYNSTALDSLWWKQYGDVTGFVALTNTSTTTVNATLETTDDGGSQLASHSVSLASHGTKIVQLLELDYASQFIGGLHIQYNGPAGSLLAFGGLEDPNSGYSASMPFSATPESSAQVKDVSFGELGLMMGAADPMMNFPAGTTFTPYSVVRNVSDAPASVSPTLWWMANGVAQSHQLSTLTLSPGQSRILDFSSYALDAGLKTFSGSLNLVLEVNGKAGAVLMAAGSVDHTETYVFEVTPRAVLESASKSLAYWSTANGDDTMVTIWNPADESQNFVFRILFSGGHYSVPINLGPRATRVFNISDFIDNQVPDAEGNVIPLSTHEGSAILAGSQADNQLILIASDAGVYNVKKATCGMECYTCDGATSVWMTPSPFFVETDQSISMSLMDEWDTGEEFNLSDEATWSGGGPIYVSSTGEITGVFGDSASVSASDSSEPIYMQYCGPAGPDPCPLAFGIGSGSSGQVGDVTPVITGISPSTLQAGQSNQELIIEGVGFGTNAPTLSFSPSSGITYSLSSYDDNQIIASVSVASNTPNETLDVSVTSNGYSQYGSGFYPGGGSQSSTSSQSSVQVQATSQPTANVTIKFNGSLSTGDKLQFAGSTTGCQNTLGPVSCPAPVSLWEMDIEGTAAVSDDASNWIVSQTMTGGRQVGYWKDTSGQLHRFANDLPSHADGPAINFLQNTKGTTNLFWIDGPGQRYTYPGGPGPVDSVKVVQNFQDVVCREPGATNCVTITWHATVIVNAGAQFDTTDSLAGTGLGSASLKF